jgi:uncharacterized protein YjbJ (UPF0337 family)
MGHIKEFGFGDNTGEQIAHIIHRAQTLQGKAQERVLAGKSKQGRRV